MKNIVPRLLLSLMVLLAGVLIAEWVARRVTQQVIRQEAERRSGQPGVTTPDALYLNTPAGRRLVPGSSSLIRNHPVSGRDVTLEVGSLGFRGPDVPVPKPAHETRVLVLGDSITLANYVAATNTWVHHVERYLGKAHPGDSVRVINAGIDGIGTREEIDLLEEKVAVVDPDYVLLAWYLNDSRPPDGFAGSIANRGWLRRRSILAETFYRRFKLARWTRNQAPLPYGSFAAVAADPAWRKDREAFARLTAVASSDWGAAWRDAAWAITRRELERFRALADEHGFKPVVVAFPVKFQVEAEFSADEPQRRLGALASELGMPFLDLLPELRRYRDRPLFFDWCHPLEETNELIGLRAAEFLDAKVIGAPSGATVTKDAKPFILYVLGESTAYGEPFHAFFDLGRLVSHLFRGVIDGRPIEVRNLAGVGISSEDVLKTARGIPRDASLVLAYTGHNEFLKYDTEHNLAEQKRALCDMPTVSRDRREPVIEAYAANVEQLILLMKKKRMPLILGTQVSNVANWGPNRSVLEDESHRDAIRELVQEAEEHMRRGKLREMKETYLAVLELEPHFAWAHKRLGDCFFLEQGYEEAWKHYVLAKDNDGNPYRALERQNEILFTLAEKHGVPLADAVARFRSQESHRLIGFNLMLDNCHPKVGGYVLLADVYAAEIEKLLGVTRRGRTLPRVEEVEAFFGVGPREKARVDQVSGQYCYVHATLTWNPEDRLNRADYYFDRAAAFETNADLLVSRALLNAMRGDAVAVRARC